MVPQGHNTSIKVNSEYKKKIEKEMSLVYKYKHTYVCVSKGMLVFPPPVFWIWYFANLAWNV